MCVYESTNNKKIANHQKSSHDKKLETMRKSSELHSLDPSIEEAAKSLCQISTNNNLSSGFFIQLFKGEEQFFCLMTNEQVIKREMIEQKQKITILYEFEKRVKEIQLNPEERIIKDFKDIVMDAIVIEILPKDNIPQDYFLLPLLDYMDNYNKLIGQDIAIIQYSQRKMKYSFGKIKYITKLQSTKYEFAHDANIDNGLSGSPIFLEGTTKVVGIHKGRIESKEENYGDFIWPIFNYFKNFKDNINGHNNNYFYNESNNVRKVKNILNNNNINFGNNANTINKRNKSKTKNDSQLIQNNSNNDKLNKMTIIYKNKSYNSIRLFGDDFVKNNINNCYLLIDGQQTKIK